VTLLSISGEVLRGMHVEAQPLRVGRRAAAELPVPQPEPAESHDVEAVQRIEAERRAARAEGEQAGYAEGLRRGLADAQREAEAALQEALAQARHAVQAEGERLASLCKSLEGARCDVLRGAEDDLVALCYETVCRIVGDTALDPAVVRNRVQQFAALWGDRPGAVLHLHPQDAELIEATGVVPGIGYIADPEVVLGGCMVRSTGDSLDARLETALVACRDALLATRARRLSQEQGA